ncbi:hypothetical protein BACCAP_02094 [Pseudoflavonifractor capillosus ATCC 29799]|uniref:Uncharacterized protein n=1 Tax=Pseudoflavonifractor capillosus ATCC 29799 TaxID=411467 RepID=A6NV60_9FIRM|nr:hypothetical protein BACCAP_02094 [Pseudoflavonifractor capillosus ATCC 29799]
MNSITRCSAVSDSSQASTALPSFHFEYVFSCGKCDAVGKIY